MSLSDGTELPINQESSTCVVYARDTGAVLHVHTICVLPGGTPATDEEVAEEALELARRQDLVSGDIAVISISADEVLSLTSSSRVNPSTGRLDVHSQTRLGDV